MFNVIYTMSLDRADEVVAKTWSFENKENAVVQFNEKLLDVINEAIGNEYLQCKVSMHKHKAVIHLMDTHYVIAVVEDGGIFKNKE